MTKSIDSLSKVNKNLMVQTVIIIVIIFPCPIREFSKAHIYISLVKVDMPKCQQ